MKQKREDISLQVLCHVKAFDQSRNGNSVLPSQ